VAEWNCHATKLAKNRRLTKNTKKNLKNNFDLTFGSNETPAWKRPGRPSALCAGYHPG
jgi:hypothetical protein